MKMEEEDLRPYNNGDFSFMTDDETHQAELTCTSEDDYSESDNSVPTENPSNNCIDTVTPTWPQSYRQSMDMFTSVTPPSISCLTGTDTKRLSGFLSSVCKRRRDPDIESPLSRPLLSETSLDKEEVPTSTLPVKVSDSSQIGSSSITDLPPLQMQCSFSQSLLNGINVLCGIGLITAPYALSEGGWFGLFLLLFYASAACYTGILLKRCLESSPGLQTYPDIGQAAFGVAGRSAISILLYIELYAACVEYLIMMSDNLSRLFPGVHLNYAGLNLDCHHVFAIVATLLVLPTVWLRDLSLLSYVSVGGVLSSTLLVLCLLWVGVVDHVGFHPSGTVLDLANIPVAIGIYGFGYAGHAVFPNIYSSMNEKAKFTAVLITSFIFCWILYTGVAVCGFLMFGDAVESQFTLNMPKQLAASKVAIWTAVVTPLSKYALTITPIVLSLEELMPGPNLRCYGVSLLLRTVLVTSSLVVALKVPFFAIVMALVGSFLSMLVAFIIPCACYLSIHRGRLTKLQASICIFIIIVGLVSAACGTYSSIARLAGKFAD